MEDLFGNEIKPIKIYNRDSAGRFSDEKTAKYERALKDGWQIQTDVSCCSIPNERNG